MSENRSDAGYSLFLCVSSKVVKRKPRMSLKQLAQMDSGEDLLGMETNKKILLLIFASVCHAILNFLKNTFVFHTFCIANVVFILVFQC